MSATLHARVRNGRLEIDELFDLPEGTELELVAVGANEALSDDEQARLDEAVDAGVADLHAGRVHAHDDVMTALHAMFKP